MLMFIREMTGLQGTASMEILFWLINFIFPMYLTFKIRGESINKYDKRMFNGSRV